MLGIEVINKTVNESVVFSTENWAKGIYLVKISDGSFVQTNKINVVN